MSDRQPFPGLIRIAINTIGEDRYHRFIRPHYRATRNICLFAAGIADFLGRIAPLIKILFFLSLAILAFCLLRLFLAPSESLKKTAFQALVSSAIFGVAFAIQLQFGGTITEQVPGGEGLQERVGELVLGVDRLNRTAEEANRKLGTIADIEVKTAPPKLLERLTDALELGDGTELLAISKEGHSKRAVARVLSDGAIAGNFFEQSIPDRPAMQWLRDELDRGLDPNLLVKRKDGKYEAILVTAFRAANADGVAALLEAGANPHAYQDLSFYPVQNPLFASPISALIDSNFTQEEKVRLARLMVENGIILPRAPQISSDSIFGVESWTPKVVEWLDANGIRVPRPVADVCSQPTAGGCGRSENKGAPQCDYRSGMPRYINLKGWLGNAYDNATILGLLGVYHGSSYYLAAIPNSSIELAVIGVSADRSRWTYYKYAETGRYESVCRERSGTQSASCWLPQSVNFDPKTKRPLVGRDTADIAYCAWKPW